MIACTIAEVRAGDEIRFSDGKGGYVLAPVLRVRSHRAGIEVLFGTGGQSSEYRIFGESVQCMRVARRGERGS